MEAGYCDRCGTKMELDVDRDDETGAHHVIGADCPNRCGEVAYCCICEKPVGEYEPNPAWTTCCSCGQPIHEEIADCAVLMGDELHCWGCVAASVGEFEVPPPDEEA